MLIIDSVRPPREHTTITVAHVLPDWDLSHDREIDEFYCAHILVPRSLALTFQWPPMLQVRQAELENYS